MMTDRSSGRFHSAAAHYLEGRPPYPPELIERVRDRLGLQPTDRLMDLGCGPAQLAVAFAPWVGEVLALDPEPTMLALAAEASRHQPKIKIAPGGSADLADLNATFASLRAVLIGRAFHWMDRSETLAQLDRLVDPDGAVVLFADERPAVPENAWREPFRAILERYAADDEGRRRGAGFQAHLSILLDSPFSNLEEIAIIRRRMLTPVKLAAYALSMSSTSPGRLGSRTDELLTEIRNWAAASHPDGAFQEVLISKALIARRCDREGDRVSENLDKDCRLNVLG
jgi:SAM-dependent methyltransferase